MPTFARSEAELAEVVSRRPFPDLDEQAGSTLFVSFLRREPPLDLQRALSTLAQPIDRLTVVGREVYWLRRRHLGETRFSNARIERVLGQPATLRGMNTVRGFLERFRVSS